MRKIYLGDGVYVTIQFGEIILTTENGVETTNTIVLDGMVWQNLIDVVQAQILSRPVPESG